GLVGGALAQRVLNDPKPRLRFEQSPAQLGRVGDRDPAVVDCKDRLRRTNLLAQLFNQRRLLLSIHISPTISARSQAGAAVEPSLVSMLRLPRAYALRGRGSWAGISCSVEST